MPVIYISVIKCQVHVRCTFVHISLSTGTQLQLDAPPPAPPPPPPPPEPIIRSTGPAGTPPPPLPPVQSCSEVPLAISLAGPVSGAPSEVVQPSDGRANLLESIRNAGGIGKAKLRNVKERKLEKKKQKEQEQVRAVSSAGDFMSDLFNKLAMRRKGISGKGPAGESSDTFPGTATGFASMSDVIPPLPAPQSTTDDDDWEA